MSGIILTGAGLTAPALPLLLEDFTGSTLRTGIGDPTDTLWAAYAPVGQNESGALDTTNHWFTLTFTGPVLSTPSSGPYFQFFPKPNNTYAFPNGYAQTYIKSGTWQPSLNRLTFWIRSSATAAIRPSNGSDNFQIGTYIRTHGDPNSDNQGQHYYHTAAVNWWPNRWRYIVLNRRPQHRVGTSTGWQIPDNPEAQGPAFWLTADTSLALPVNVVNGSATVTIPCPTGVSATPSVSGGSIVANTYYYKVTAVTAGGETIPSAEVSATTTGSTGSVALSWSAMTGATSYKVYRSTTSGGQTGSPSLIGSTVSTALTDTLATPNAGAVSTNSWSFTTTNYYYFSNSVTNNQQLSPSAMSVPASAASGSTGGTVTLTTPYAGTTATCVGAYFGIVLPYSYGTSYQSLTDYYDGLTRFYVDCAPDGNANPGTAFDGSTWNFSNFYFDNESNAPDSLVSTVMCGHTTGDSSGHYELSWASIVLQSVTYDIYYGTSDLKNADGSYNGSGTHGGSVSNPGSTYVCCYWDSPTMAEAAVMYFMIVPQGQSGTALGTQIAMQKRD